MKKGINVLSQAGSLQADVLSSRLDILTSLTVDAAKGEVPCRLVGLKTNGSVDWIDAIVRGIDQPVNLPLKSL